ncbi:MAG: hypothetical protein Q9175_002063 [Cornicularia normoerica]
MAEQVLETYHGNCHCGAFKFSKGYLWAFPSSDDLFVVEKSDGTLKDYQFGKKTMSHKVRPKYLTPKLHLVCVYWLNAYAMKFCSNCGTPVMGRRHIEGPSIGVNVRTFREFDAEKLETKPYDGASLEPHYIPPNGPEASDMNKSTKCYQGSCHCGNVSYDLQSKALEDIEVWSCNCSICSRNADLWVYPFNKDVELRGGNHLTIYRFGRKAAGHAFCSTCGVPIVNNFERPEANVHVNEFMTERLPVNVRTIDGIDLKALKVNELDGKGLR